MNLVKTLKIKSLVLVFLSVIFMNYGCSDGVSLGGINLFSISDDVKLGAEVVAEMRQDQTNYPVYNNAEATAYVQAIVDEIIQSPLVKYRDDFNYKITIIDTETINAFALPGGYIHVYKGLLKYMDNEASLAAVLAHEIGHAELRHAKKKINQSLRCTVTAWIADLVRIPSQLEEIAGKSVTGLGFLYNSREEWY